MIRLTFNRVAFIFALLSTAPSFAITTEHPDVYSTPLGCMGCHQGASLQTEDNSEVKQDNQIKTTETESTEKG